MKRVNIVFIGECIIIALLLIVLGVLLNSNSSNSFAKNITKETEIAEEMSGNQENVDNSATGVLSSIINTINDDEAAQNETEIVKSYKIKRLLFSETVFGMQPEEKMESVNTFSRKPGQWFIIVQ